MMTQAASLQLYYELKVHRNHGCGGQHINGICRDRRLLAKSNISSRAMRQESWGFLLVKRTKGSISPVPSSCNIFICRSLLGPGGGNDNPVVKSGVIVLARAYDALQGSPVLLRLIPAVGIIAFATWGVGPLIRLGRVLLLNRTDAGKKNSGTHSVMTSYIQPLLLWTGAMLICRALDPVILPSDASHAVKLRLLNFVRSLSTVLAFAYCLSSLIQQAQKFLTETNDTNDARNMGFSFAGKAIYTAVWVAAVSLFMELLGFSAQKWLTAGGLGTVLLTLAGREIFTNFLSSVMIHATRPFVLNEWIQTKIDGYEVSGTVEHVGWWSPTIIRGDDREAVHIPNHKFTVNIVRNLSQKAHWRIKTHLAISHLDVHKIHNIVADMRKVLAKNPQVEQQRLHRRVFLEDVDPENQALRILISCFVKTSRYEEYSCVKEAILLDLLRVIKHHGARLATPIRTVQKMHKESDSENVTFSDIVFTQASSNRRLILIEPSYKINESKKDKVKTASSAASTSTLEDAEPKDVVGGSSSEEKVQKSMGSSPKERGGPEKLVVNSEPGMEKNDSQTKREFEKPPRPPLENIVLGVALEGSKLTLPIEEEMDSPPADPEPKEFPANRNGKDGNDGQSSVAPGSTQME